MEHGTLRTGGKARRSRVGASPAGFHSNGKAGGSAGGSATQGKAVRIISAGCEQAGRCWLVPWVIRGGGDLSLVFELEEEGGCRHGTWVGWFACERGAPRESCAS